MKVARTTIWMLICLLAAGLAPAHAGTLDKAKQALEDEDYEDAVDLFLKVLEKDARNRDAIVGLAEACIKGGVDQYFYEAQEALNGAGGLLRLNPQDWDGWVLLGEVFLGRASGISDPTSLKLTYADAATAFEKAYKAQKDNERAAVGLARSHFGVAEFEKALAVLDEYIEAHPKASPKAMFWKGETLYLQARDAHAAAGSLTEDVKKMYMRAKGAYEASAIADGSSYKTWIQLAYAAHYVTDFNTASKAYEQAAGLNEKSDLPLRGLQSLLAQSRRPQYTAALDRLAGAYPKHYWIMLYRGMHHVDMEEWEKAVSTLKKAVRVGENPADAYYWMGKAQEALTQTDKARSSYEEALKENPNHERAAGSLELLIWDGKEPQAAVLQMSLSKIKEMIARYKKLFEMAPNSPWIRNNLGLLLRDAWVRRGQADNDWRVVLDESAAAYVAASKIIGEWDATLSQTLSFQVRYSYAQVISDTGLMFQFHKPIEDLDRAELYYLRALDFSDYGYYDAWNNLRQIYAAQEKWDELYDLALMCADGLVTANLNEHFEGRAQARAVAKQLLDEGKVEDN